MKKGQVQVQETILVLFIFIVILVIGLIFFYKYNAQSLRDSVFEVEQNKFNGMLSTFPQNPEIRCSYLGEDISCIDSYKLLGFMDIVGKESGYYKKKFGFKNITIYSVYPNKNPIKCDFNNIENCGVWKLYLNKPQDYNKVLIIKTPISLYFPNKDDYAIGEMVIEWYT